MVHQNCANSICKEDAQLLDTVRPARIRENLDRFRVGCNHILRDIQKQETRSTGSDCHMPPSITVSWTCLAATWGPSRSRNTADVNLKLAGIAGILALIQQQFSVIRSDRWGGNADQISRNLPRQRTVNSPPNVRFCQGKILVSGEFNRLSSKELVLQFPDLPVSVRSKDAFSCSTVKLLCGFVDPRRTLAAKAAFLWPCPWKQVFHRTLAGPPAPSSPARL